MNYLDAFNNYWSRADRWGSHSFDNAEALFQRVSMISGKGSVLDVGCGMGLLVRTLLEHGVEAMGVDIALRPVEESNRKNPGRFCLGSILQLPFADNSWDTIVSTDCLHHLAEADVPRALTELKRVARRNVYINLATRADRDKRWHLTVRGREWWEQQFFAAGFRRHALDQVITSYDSRESDGAQITMVFEKIPEQALARYPLAALQAERALHMDMTREPGRRSDAHIARYVTARRYLPREGIVIDGACGLGYGSAVLGCTHPDVKVIGLDNSEYAVNYAAASFAPMYPNLEFRQGDVCDLSAFADGTVALVVSFETVEHLREPERFLQEVRRVLRPDGHFVCSVPNMWVDETGKDPNPWHFHVFDFAKIVDLCAQHLTVCEVFNQTAGGGMKLPGAPRRIRRVNLPMTQGDDQAEWWLVAASREKLAMNTRPRVQSSTVLVLTHDPKHPLLRSWLDHCPHPVVYETALPSDYDFPEEIGLLVTADCYKEPSVTLIARAKERGIPTLLLADGILEYRNTFEHPQTVPGSLFQPVLAHKIACLGRSQARILESWGNAAQCEITGCARFDRYATLRRRQRAAGEPFRVLVMTAITPYFTSEQHEQVRRSLLDLKAFFAATRSLNGNMLEVAWRITKGLETEVGVSNTLSDLSGRELAEVLQKVDAVISTPSTSMLEGMLLGLPVAVLDYTNSPHYVQPAWRITASEHIGAVLRELIAPPAPKMLFQETTLHDALECASPAAPRLLRLATEMMRLGQEAREAGIALELPLRLLGIEANGPVTEENRFQLAALFPGHAPFRDQRLPALQVEVGHLRAYAAQLERRTGGAIDPQQVDLAVKWRAKLEAAKLVGDLRNASGAVRLLLDALKIVEASKRPETILEGLVEVTPVLARFDATRARMLTQTAIALAERMGRVDVAQGLRDSLKAAVRAA